MTDPLEQVNSLIAGATAGDPDVVSIELTFTEFPDVGAALDATSEILEARGYHLVRVMGAEDRWAARYERR